MTRSSPRPHPQSELDSASSEPCPPGATLEFVGVLWTSDDETGPPQERAPRRETSAARIERVLDNPPPRRRRAVLPPQMPTSRPEPDPDPTEESAAPGAVTIQPDDTTAEITLRVASTPPRKVVRTHRVVVPQRRWDPISIGLVGLIVVSVLGTVALLFLTT